MKDFDIVIHRGTLIDGVERNQRAPQTFEIPSDEVKAVIGPDHYVKIGVEDAEGFGERFWVLVKAITAPGVFVGIVRNDLERTAQHGLKCDDLVRFEARHILATE